MLPGGSLNSLDLLLLLLLFQVKINGSNEEMLRAAAEQFGAKSTEEIIFVSKETLEGRKKAFNSIYLVNSVAIAVRHSTEYNDAQ